MSDHAVACGVQFLHTPLYLPRKRSIAPLCMQGGGGEWGTGDEGRARGGKGWGVGERERERERERVRERWVWARANMPRSVLP